MKYEYSDDYLIDYCIKEMIYVALFKGFGRNGIEGTEELIKKNFRDKQKDLMLNAYKKWVFGKEK